jgi:GxxExxY protein
MAEIIYKEESYSIIRACFEVYKEMGCGFLEPVYQECLELELQFQSIVFRARSELTLRYKDRLLTQKFIPDFICFRRAMFRLLHST